MSGEDDYLEKARNRAKLLAATEVAREHYHSVYYRLSSLAGAFNDDEKLPTPMSSPSKLELPDPQMLSMLATSLRSVAVQLDEVEKALDEYRTAKVEAELRNI